MTPNEFWLYLQKAPKQGINSCAFLISYNGETCIGSMTACSKYLSKYFWFKAMILSRRGTSKDKERKDETDALTDFLRQHWEDLEFKVLKTSPKTRYPVAEIRNLYEKYQPTLTPLRTKEALGRFTVARKVRNKERSKFWSHNNYLRHKTGILDKTNKYKKEHREQVREYQKKWREENAESIKEYRREYRRIHRDEIRKQTRERNKKYYRVHRNEINAKRREKRLESKQKQN